MPRLTQFLVLAVAALMSAPSNSVAQGDAMVELYGEGVHNYFCSNYAAAESLLTQVIDAGSQDPRAYYFRGLCHEVQGLDGQLDFETGARFEAEGRRVVNVGQALMRIQGRSRMKIEKARQAARIQVRLEQLAKQLERQNTIPKAAPEAAEPPPPAVTNDPFAGDMTAPEKVPAEVDAKQDPFVDDPEPSDSPFGDAPAGEASPFGDPAPADAGSPFGEPAPADAGSPFDTPAAGDPADNPFGGGDSPFDF